MNKHIMTKAEEKLFLENIVLTLQIAEIGELVGKISPDESSGHLTAIYDAANRGSRRVDEYSSNVFIDGLNEGAFTLSQEKIILYCNNHFAQLLNSTVEQVIGTRLNRYVMPGDLAKLDDFVHAARLSKTTIDISCLTVNVNTTVKLRLSVNYLPGAYACENEFYIASDISEFIRMENKLRHAQPITETGLAERTEKLIRDNKDMISSRMATLNMMEDAVEAKNNLEATNQKLVAEIGERKRSELIQQVLFSISNAALVTRDVEALVAIIRSELGKLLDTKNFYLAFYDEVSDMLWTPYSEDEKDGMDTWPAARSFTGMVIKDRKNLLVNKKEMLGLIKRGEIDLVGTLSEQWLGVPLVVDDTIIGAFVVQSYDNANAYDIKDMELLEFISHQISLSIQRKKTFQDLTTALSKAKESDLLKTEFLHNISHEIRTPMNAILGFSDLLNEPDLLPDERKSYTEIITHSGRHLLTILEDIINISELEAGKEVFMPVQSNLNQILREIYAQYKLKASGRNIEIMLTTPLADELANIITDETKLIQIISNLMNNALKFTEQGRIDFGYTLKNGNLQFYIGDTGVGIAADKHNSIFDRFKQVEINLSKENGGRGLGLGLSISKAYIELFGGKIWLKSEPGKGSVFYFSIPYAPARIQKQGV